MMATPDTRLHEKLADLEDTLRAVSDDQLEELCGRASIFAISRVVDSDTEAILADPVFRVECAYADLVAVEWQRRRDVLAALEADLADGHPVRINDQSVGMFTACCDPAPWTDVWCWTGPERATLAEAVADAKTHAPNVEPVVGTNWPDNGSLGLAS
jgi:hypothetical protein